MTFKEIVEKLEEMDVTPGDLEIYSNGYFIDNKKLKKIFGEIQIMESISNPDDSEVRVLYFIDHDVYIRLTGYNSSYTGIHMDNDYTEVFPYQQSAFYYATPSEKKAMKRKKPNLDDDSYSEDEESYSF